MAKERDGFLTFVQDNCKNIFSFFRETIHLHIRRQIMNCVFNHESQGCCLKLNGIHNYSHMNSNESCNQDSLVTV